MRWAGRPFGYGALSHDGTLQPIFSHANGSLTQIGMALVPVGGALECIACSDKPRFVEMAADKLEGNGAAVRGKAARKRECRTAGHIEWTSEAEQSADQGGVLGQRRHLGERGGGKRLGWDRDKIYRL